MADPFRDNADSVSAPARRCFDIVPSDSEPLPFVVKAIRAGADGTIRLRAIDSTADIDHPVLKGERIDVRATHVRAAGTTVTLIGYA